MLTLLQRPKEHGLCLIRKLAWSPDGRYLAAVMFHRKSGEPFSSVLLWDLNTSADAQLLETFPSRILSLTFAAGGRFLATGVDHHTVQTWDMENGRQVRTLPIEPIPRPNPPRRGVRPAYVPPTSPRLVAFHRSNTLLCHCRQKWYQWDLDQQDSNAIDPVSNNLSIESIVLTLDDKSLIFVTREGALYRCSNPANPWKDEEIFNHVIQAERIIVSRCGTKFAFADGSHLKVGELPRTRGGFKTLSGHQSFVYAATFGPDVNTIITGGQDGTTRIWNVEREQEVEQFDWGIGRVTALEASPDGTIVAAGGDGDQNLVLWDLE